MAKLSEREKWLMMQAWSQGRDEYYQWVNDHSAHLLNDAPTPSCQGCEEKERDLDEAISLLQEVSEPGVFGPGYGGTDDPRLGPSFRELCERRGYGAVMHTASYLWEQKQQG